MQDPANNLAPVNVATGPPVVVVTAVWTFETVETVAMLSEVMVLAKAVARPDKRFAVVPLPPDEPVVSSGEHPRKFGMLTLYVAQREISKASAAEHR